MGFIDRFARELAGVFEKENKTTSVYRLRWYVLIKFFFKDKAEKIEKNFENEVREMLLFPNNHWSASKKII